MPHKKNANGRHHIPKMRHAVTGAGVRSCQLPISRVAGRQGHGSRADLASCLAAAQANDDKCPRVMSPRPASRPRNRIVLILAGASRRLTNPSYALRLRDAAASERVPPAWVSPGWLRRPLKTKARTATSPRPGRFFANAGHRAPTGVWDSPQFDCLINRPEADWIGRAFIGYSREKMPTCSGEIGTGWRSTIQSTPSEQGGVVSEPM